MGPGREVNADAFALNLEGSCLAFAVADGVGALPGSPFASAAAALAVIEWAQAKPETPSFEALSAHVTERVGAALRPRSLNGATTLVVALIAGGEVTVASIGDSGALAIPASGPAKPLHKLDHVPSRPNILTAWIDGEAAFEPHRGTPARDSYALCLVTDGVSGSLRNEQIADIVRSTPLEDAAALLVKAARAAGSHDDATALVLGAEHWSAERAS